MSGTSEKIIAESAGQITSTTVLPPNGTRSRFEANYAGNGTLAGHQVRQLITYEAESVGTNAISGTARGIITATDGADTATFLGGGAGYRAEGSLEMVWQGYLALESQSPKFASLNGLLVRAVIKVGDDGKVNYQAMTWE
ncbi:MAG: hypothetical protein WCD21_12645 [Streptomyces sp.]